MFYKKLSNFIFYFILFLTIYSILHYKYVYSNFQKYLFILMLFILMLFNVRRINKNILLEFIIISLYLIYGFLIGTLRNIKFYDLIISYLPFIYFFILSFFVGKYFLEPNIFKKIFNFLIVAFVIKYSYMKFIFHIPRPDLFTENNYELVMLILMFIGMHLICKEKKQILIYIILVTYIVILSFSRSAIVEWLFVLFILFFNPKFNLKLLFQIILFIISIILVLVIFKDRLSGGSLTSIDRYDFFIYFLDNIKDWNFIDYLIGNKILTLVNTATSKHFFYFTSLHSHTHPGMFYSVIYHMAILRMIFDHGILGLLFILYFINKILIISNYNRRYRLAILSVFILNTLSVSSFYNIMSIIGLLFLIILNKKDIKENNEN